MPPTARRLAAVTDATPAPKPRRPRTKSVTQAARSGTRLELLIAMRTRLAKDVESPNTPSRDLAALTRRLMDVAKEIEALQVAAEEEGRGADASPDEEFDASAV